MVINRDSFLEIAQRYAEKEHWELVQFMQSVDLFRAWSQSRVYRICKLLQRNSWQPGDVIIQQGEEGDFMCFLRMGKLKVSVKIS